MSIGRWMDKKAVVHIHNGILLSYWKESIWISFSEVDETRAYDTQWSKSERKTPINILMHIYEFRKSVTMTLYARQQKRHRYKEQTFGLCRRSRGWDDLREQHWNMHTTIREIDDQSKFNALNRVLKAGALGQPWGMGWGGRQGGFQDGGTHIQPLLIHVKVRQKPLQYCKVISLQLK